LIYTKHVPAPWIPTS